MPGKVRLKAAASFTSDAPTNVASDGKSLDKRCLIVYEGQFDSMDGPVTVTDKHLQKLYDNHNGFIAHLAKMAGGGEIPLKHSPPMQVDHSVSGWDTVGRLVGKVELGLHTRADGKEVKALYGTARVLGSDNVERVQDGRWTNLSIGADLEKGKISELTVTPFSAAEDASFLQAGDKPTVYKEKKIYICQVGDEMSFTWTIRHDDGNEMGCGSAPSREKCLEEAKAAIDGLPPVVIKLGGSMDKMKKYLMEHKKMSEKEADEHLTKMADAPDEKAKLSKEIDEHEAKMAADKEADDKEKAERLAKEESDKKAAELTANLATLTQLSTDFRKSYETAAQLQRRGSITSKLSRLKAMTKITPAEIKKLSLDDVAKKTDAELASFFEGYEKREPQVLTGLVGSKTAEDIAKVAQQTRMSKLEAEMRGNMSLLSQVDKNKDPAEKKKRDEDDPLPGTPAAGGAAGGAEDDDKDASEIERMMDENLAQAKEMFRAYCKRMNGRMTGGATDDLVSEQEKSSEGLASALSSMHTQMEQISKLSATISGVKL